MGYGGQVESEKIVIDDDVMLPEGAVVEVRLVEENSGPSLYERLKSVIGKAQGLPPDAAQNVDYYLYGQPKQQ
jgi:hypothetical protein